MKKKVGTRILSLLMILVMALSLLPTAAMAEEGESASSAAVTYTVQGAGAFMAPPQVGAEVSADLAESYGYTDSVTDGVSTLDVLVAANKTVFGADFTMDTCTDYLAINESGWVTTAFGNDGGTFSFAVNDVAPSTLINQTAVTDGDRLAFNFYADETGYSDMLTWFTAGDSKQLSGAVGTELAVKLNGSGYDSSWNTVTLPVANAQLCWVNMADGTLTAIDGAVTDADGNAAVTLPDEAGTYYLSASCDSTYIFLPFQPVTVTELNEITVSLALYGDSQHGAEGGVHHWPAEYLQQWIAPATYTVSKDTTVQQLLEQVLNEKGFSYELSTSTYGGQEYINIASIKGLANGDNGDNSVWMYLLNGGYGDSLNVQQLHNGDKLEFYYTDDWNKDSQTEPDLKPASMTPDNDVNPDVKGITAAATNYVASITEPAFSNEWLVLGLARNGVALTDSFKDSYFQSVVKTMQENDGVLSSSKYTEYSRTVLALTALGYDPTNVGGYNLLAPLTDFKAVTKQGVNGAVFALIALDSHNYEIPAVSDGKTQTTRENLIQFILDSQLSDNGWTFSGDTADVDMTAMTIQALAPYYKTNTVVKTAVDAALALLSDRQDVNGGYASYGDANSESNAQVLVALTALGIDPESDVRFLKNGHSVVDALCAYYVGEGGFSHVADGTVNGLATTQAYYALAAYARFQKGLTRLYDMSDVDLKVGAVTDSSNGGTTTPNNGSDGGQTADAANGANGAGESGRSDAKATNTVKTGDDAAYLAAGTGFVLAAAAFVVLGKTKKKA